MDTELVHRTVCQFTPSAFTGTQCTNPRRDGQAELRWVPGLFCLCQTAVSNSVLAAKSLLVIQTHENKNLKMVKIANAVRSKKSTAHTHAHHGSTSNDSNNVTSSCKLWPKVHLCPKMLLQSVAS